MYSENECGSNDISLQFVEFSNVLHKNIARSRLFCRIAERSIVNLVAAAVQLACCKMADGTL